MSPLSREGAARRAGRFLSWVEKKVVLVLVVVRVVLVVRRGGAAGQRSILSRWSMAARFLSSSSSWKTFFQSSLMIVLRP